MHSVDTDAVQTNRIIRDYILCLPLDIAKVRYRACLEGIFIMRYLNGTDGLEVVLSLMDLNDIIDEFRMLTMPPVLAGLERLDAPIGFIAKQLGVPEISVEYWQTGKRKLPVDRQVRLCEMLEQGIKLYEDVLAGYESDNIDRPFYEIGVLKEHIRSAKKLLNIQREMITTQMNEGGLYD